MVHCSINAPRFWCAGLGAASLQFSQNKQFHQLDQWYSAAIDAGIELADQVLRAHQCRCAKKDNGVQAGMFVSGRKIAARGRYSSLDAFSIALYLVQHLESQDGS